MLVAARMSSSFGIWGGERSNMVIGPKAATIDFDCGKVLITMPLKIDAQGVFSARGSFEDFSSAPVNPDQPAKRQPAAVEGKVSGNVLDLTVRISGESEPRRLRLQRNHSVKLIRCM